MGRKGSWFSSVKKALSPDSKEKKSQKANKSKNKWFGKEKTSIPDSPTLETESVSPPLPPPEELNLTEVEDEQTKHAYSVAVATAAAAEAAVAATHAAAEAVRRTAMSRFPGKSTEEVAAIKIQTAFRGYLARRGLRALRGLVRLKSLVEGPMAKRQTMNTLKCMQTLSRVQSQINSRRIRISEENQALQRQLLQKRAKELVSLQMGEEWDDSAQSKEQVEVKLLSKYEASMRRERAMAYSFSHQQTWKKPSRPANLLFMDPTNPQWGWSWLERYMAARPWETRGPQEKEPNSTISVAGEITKSYARHQLNSDKPSPSANQKSTMAGAKKSKHASPRGNTFVSPDDDSKSVFSVQSEVAVVRRHSIATSSVRDDESLGSSPSIPSYMAPTRSAKAKTRLNSPLGVEGGTTPEKGTPVYAKKRLSFPASPARPRRHSGPPKVDVSLATVHGVENGVVS
ncbi:hypothetical protein LguiA_032267 [Lonicera macranthoides]